MPRYPSSPPSGRRPVGRVSSKVTSKLQVTLPKLIADHYGIQPGDEIEWEPEQGFIRVVPPGRRSGPHLEPAERLRLFREGRTRQRAREAGQPAPALTVDRGWTREELYDRERPD